MLTANDAVRSIRTGPELRLTLHVGTVSLVLCVTSSFPAAAACVIGSGSESAPSGLMRVAEAHEFGLGSAAPYAWCV
jgi:hypothetical protein